MNSIKDNYFYYLFCSNPVQWCSFWNDYDRNAYDDSVHTIVCFLVVSRNSRYHININANTDIHTLLYCIVGVHIGIFALMTYLWRTPSTGYLCAPMHMGMHPTVRINTHAHYIEFNSVPSNSTSTHTVMDAWICNDKWKCKSNQTS